MNALEIEYESRGALREALLDSFAEGGIFVEGNYEITSGSPIVVRVGVAGLDASVFVEGIIQWRRVGPGVRAAGVAPGVGVRFLPNQRDRFDFLQRFADGSVEGSGRFESRYPCEVRVFLTATTRVTGRIVHAGLRDVSLRGASVAIGARLDVSQIYTLEFQFEANVYALPARVAWTTGECAGLTMTLERAEDRDVWARFVRDAMSRFESKRVPLRRPSIRPSFRPPG